MQVSFILFFIPCYVAHSLPHSALHSQSKSRYLGANSPGYTNPRDGVRMGIAPAAAATAGRIGIAARSGTLSYEATGATASWVSVRVTSLAWAVISTLARGRTVCVAL